MKLKHPLNFGVRVLGLTALIVAAGVVTDRAAGQSFIGPFNTVTTVSTTVPTNGDVNPYGVALVPGTMGNLVAGRYLVSNFNNGANAQGTGTTIVQIAPNGTFSLFARISLTKADYCPGGLGLTTALVALRSGYVIVGSLPTNNGVSPRAGCLIVLNSWGQIVETIWGHNLNGPWDMTAVDNGSTAALFVTNVLNGTVAAKGKVVNGGTIVRLLLSITNGKPPALMDSTVIGWNYEERTDPAALVIGPTGVAFDGAADVLYIADSLKNRITWIPDALVRKHAANVGGVLTQGGNLNDPLGLAWTPNHHLLEANGNDGKLVEIDPATGKQVAWKLVDDTGGPPPGAGALFGLITTWDGVYFVDDASNTFNFLH